MFFFGIFGIHQAAKPTGRQHQGICPACGRLTRFEIIKTYSYFHLFFIPLFRWNVRYLLKSACCGSVFLLDGEISRQLENGEAPEIREENLQPLQPGGPGKICPRCRAAVNPAYAYCPHCGQSL